MKKKPMNKEFITYQKTIFSIKVLVILALLLHFNSCKQVSLLELKEKTYEKYNKDILFILKGISFTEAKKIYHIDNKDYVYKSLKYKIKLNKGDKIVINLIENDEFSNLIQLKLSKMVSENQIFKGTNNLELNIGIFLISESSDEENILLKKENKTILKSKKTQLYFPVIIL